MRLYEGVQDAELQEMLKVIARETPQNGGDEAPREWQHVRLFPLTYDQLELQQDVADQTSEQRAGWAAQLWGKLASASLYGGNGGSGGGGGGGGTGESDATLTPDTPMDPLALASAIERHERDPEYDKGIVAFFGQFMDEIKAKGGQASGALKRKVSKLVTALSPETLQQILKRTSPGAQRRQFLLNASHTLAADTVLDLAKAVAGASEHTMSEALLLLLTKLAKHSEKGSPRSSREGRHRAAREHAPADRRLGRRGGAAGGELLADARAADRGAGNRCAGELGAVGCERRVRRADVAGGGAVRRDGEARGGGDGEGGSHLRRCCRWWIRRRRRTPWCGRCAGISTTRGRSGVCCATGRSTSRCCTGSWRAWAFRRRARCWNALELEDDRTARWRLFEMLAQLGPDVGNAVMARLPGSPWYVQRNLLLLMARLETWPKDFTAHPYAKHPDPRVRREAYALLLRDPATRAESIALAVADSDERIVRAALNAALEGGCPREAVGVLTARLDQRSLDGMMAVLAIRVIAPVRLPVVLDVLVKSALSRKRTWFFGRKLAPKSQPMLAALSALAWTWAQEPQAMKVLSLAERDPDSAVQNAIRSRGP